MSVRIRCRHCYEDIVQDVPGAPWRGRLSMTNHCMPGTDVQHTPLPATEVSAS